MEISKIWIFVFIFYGSLEVGAQDTKTTAAPKDAQSVQTATTEQVWILTNENKSAANTPASEVETQNTNETAATEKVWFVNTTGDTITNTPSNSTESSTSGTGATANSTESPNSATGTSSNYSGSSTTKSPFTTTGSPSNYTESGLADDSSNSTETSNSNTTSNNSGSGNDTFNTTPQYYYDKQGRRHRYHSYHYNRRGWRWIVVGVCSFFIFTIFWIIFCKCCLVSFLKCKK